MASRGLSKQVKPKRPQHTTVLRGTDARVKGLQKLIDRSYMPTPGGPINVEFGGPVGARPGENGQPPTIYLGKLTGPTLRDSFAHELWHADDYRMPANSPRRRQFKGIMKLRGPWGEQGARDTGHPNPPREQYAEAGRVLMTNPRAYRDREGYRRWREWGDRGYGFDPSYFQLRKLAKLFRP